MMRRLGLLGLIGVFFCSSAVAATHTVNGFTTCGSGNNFSDTSTTFASGGVIGGAGGSSPCSGSVKAKAGLGELGVFAELKANGGGFIEERAFATSKYSLMLTPPSDYAGGLIPVSVNMLLDVLFFGGVSSGATFTRFVSLAAEGSVEIQGFTSPFNSVRSGRNTVSRSARADNNPSTPTSVLESVVAPLTTNTIWIDPTYRLEIDFSLSGLLQTQVGNGDTVMSGLLDGFNTFSFDPNKPAFNLPDGFTVSSAEANIFDNQWIDPTPSEVPVPAALPLLISGLMLLFGVKKMQGASKPRRS